MRNAKGAIPYALLFEIGLTILKYCLLKRSPEQIIGELRQLKPRHKAVLRRAVIAKHGRIYWKENGERLWQQAQSYLRDASDKKIHSWIRKAKDVE